MDLLTSFFSTGELTREYRRVLVAYLSTDAELLYRVSSIHSLAQSLKFEFGQLSSHLTHVSRQTHSPYLRAFIAVASIC